MGSKHSAYTVSAKGYIPTQLEFVNNCDHNIDLWKNTTGEFGWLPHRTIRVGEHVHRQVEGPGHAYRHGPNDSATMVLFDNKEDETSYAISVIPPRSLYCFNSDFCTLDRKNAGFNLPISIYPGDNLRGDCRDWTCKGYDVDKCPDAFKYAANPHKTGRCPIRTDFNIVFCPNER